MPIYEYICDDCGERYERVLLSEGNGIACPKCSSPRNTVQFSTFSARGGDSSASPSPSSASSQSSGGSCGCNSHGCGCH